MTKTQDANATTGADGPATQGEVAQGTHGKVPSLEIDKLMAERYGVIPTAHGRKERAVVAALCDALAAGGWRPVAWLDADTGPEPVANQDKKGLMELLFNLDEGRFDFTNGKATHWVYFVRGNSPEEIVADYSFSRDPGDNFAALMDAFDPENLA
jgi:hypothetical protein